MRPWRSPTPRSGIATSPSWRWSNSRHGSAALVPLRRDVARLADGRAANPFESVLRAIASSVPGLQVEPQVAIDLPTGTVYVDLADRRLAVVAEADSFAWHGSRRALWRDCRRYNRLVLRGWLVLRFAWEDVMFYPEYVRACLQKATTIAGRRERAHRSVRKAA